LKITNLIRKTSLRVVIKIIVGIPKKAKAEEGI
jgi:hypothetical protein